MHLRNIYKDEELVEQATTKEFLVVRRDGKRQVRRRIKHYNLDTIISVGFRTNTKAMTSSSWQR
ncbi:MAG: virulence RhuM family protein [Marinobacter sp.]|nr:virulence RhuM family protein [Marinobacter sp.]